MSQRFTGGGLGIGQLFLLCQDEFDHYASAMTKYFVAEGVAAGQPVLTVSADSDPQQLNKVTAC